MIIIIKPDMYLNIICSSYNEYSVSIERTSLERSNFLFRMEEDSPARRGHEDDLNYDGRIKSRTLCHSYNLSKAFSSFTLTTAASIINRVLVKDLKKKLKTLPTFRR